MVKTVKIGDKEFNLKSSAFTPFKYENEYGSDLLKDINSINVKQKEISKLATEEERSDAWINEIGGIMKMALRIAYTLIQEYDEKVAPYETWLKSLDHVFGEYEWMQEVMECAMSTFQRRMGDKQE